MRKIEYLSPSSLGLWESDREAFYLKNLAPSRPPKVPQANYMGIGSAFDAYVKADLHAALFGVGHDPAYELTTLFEEQVEPQNRDECRIAGLYAHECYKSSGAYADLLRELENSKFAPQFEFRVDKTIEGVPLMGKPDCRYIHKSGAHVILDWKVNGFFSKHGSTPYKFYSMIRDGWTETMAKPSRACNRPHKGFREIEHKGIKIGAHYLEDTCKDWADQLSIYGWMLDEEVGGEDVVVCIDQLVSKVQEGGFPLIRIANHRCRISMRWQNQLIQRLTSCWKAIQAGHIFSDMSEEESKQCQEVLDMEAEYMLLDAGQPGVESWLSAIRNDNGMRFRTR